MIDEKFETELDYQFIQRVQKQVTQSCALPFAVPVDRIPEFIIQAAQYFWINDDFAVEERSYVIPASEICQGNKLNKIVQLPQQIMGVHGVFKLEEDLKYSAAGDFSMERMLMSSYSIFGGAGELGSGFGPGGLGYSLSDVVISLYEVDTFNQTINPPLTYNFNMYSSKLVLLGELGYSDILINCMVRCRIQDLYNNPYFFKYVVALCEKSLSRIYGTIEFKLPGGVTINYSDIASDANDEIDKIEEWFEKNRAADYFFMPGTN